MARWFGVVCALVPGCTHAPVCEVVVVMFVACWSARTGPQCNAFRTWPIVQRNSNRAVWPGLVCLWRCWDAPPPCRAECGPSFPPSPCLQGPAGPAGAQQQRQLQPADVLAAPLAALRAAGLSGRKAEYLQVGGRAGGRTGNSRDAWVCCAPARTVRGGSGGSSQGGVVGRSGVLCGVFKAGDAPPSPTCGPRCAHVRTPPPPPPVPLPLPHGLRLSLPFPLPPGLTRSMAPAPARGGGMLAARVTRVARTSATWHGVT